MNQRPQIIDSILKSSTEFKHSVIKTSSHTEISNPEVSRSSITSTAFSKGDISSPTNHAVNLRFWFHMREAYSEPSEI